MRCYESLVPIVPKTLSEVRNLMWISQPPSQVGDASTFGRKSRLLRWTLSCWGWECLTHASQPMPASQREEMPHSPLLSLLACPKAGISSPALPLPLTAHHSLGLLSHTSDSNPHPCVSQTVSSLDFIPKPLLAHRTILPGTQSPLHFLPSIWTLLTAPT